MNSIINHWYTEKKEILFTSDNQILGNRLKIHRIIFGKTNLMRNVLRLKQC